MSKILIESMGFEIRTAVVANGRLQHFDIERSNHKSLAGNIYKGVAVRVLPGLNAAFLNVGEAREVFLPLSDVRESSPYEEEVTEEPEEKKRLSRRHLKVKAGDQLLVQVVKDSIGSKGPKVTASNISIAGFLAVLLPQEQRRGVSRRITEQTERERLLSIASGSVPTDFGFIIRTSAQNCREKALKAELRRLLSFWEEISGNFQSKTAPLLLRSEVALPSRVLRDHFAPEVEEVLVDSPFILKSLRRYLAMVGIDSRKVRLFQGDVPLFTNFGVEEELGKILSRKVSLSKGGYLIIEETEALCAIDVNSGRTTGEDYRSMVLRTNLLAAEEIAWQLRLRNLGGLIVIDFIDMEKAPDRKHVYQVFEKALEPDKARIKLLRFSKFGLVEMTRQRTRESLRDYLADECPTCAGRGVVASVETTAAQLRRDLQIQVKPSRNLLHAYSRKKIDIRVSPQLGEYLRKNFELVFPERMYRNKVNLVTDVAFSPGQFKIMA